MLKNIRKPYNIKLPREFQPRFSKPYDKFLLKILKLSQHFTTQVVKSSNVSSKGPKEWMIWLTNKDRQEFHQAKDQTNHNIGSLNVSVNYRP
jgi:hypothetical protein